MPEKTNISWQLKTSHNSFGLRRMIQLATCSAGCHTISRNSMSRLSPISIQRVKLAPDEPEIYLFRGSARNAAEDFAGAIADFSRVIEIMPEATEAYTYRGARGFS